MSETAIDYGSRTMPHDDVAEQSVLGGMLLSKDAIADVVESLRASDFYKPAHETIYEAILSLYGHGSPADAITVADELKKRGELTRVGGASYIHTLIASVPTAANAQYYAEIVKEHAIMRRLIEAGTKIAQLGYANETEVDTLVDQAQAEIYAVTDGNAKEDYVSFSEALEETINEIDANSNRPDGVYGVPTDFIEFDELTGGLHGGQMIVIAARPGVGKSTLALDIARSAAIHHQMTTVFFSLEMSRTELAMRILSAEGKISMGRLKKGDLDTEGWPQHFGRLRQVDHLRPGVQNQPGQYSEGGFAALLFFSFAPILYTLPLSINGLTSLRLRLFAGSEGSLLGKLLQFLPC